MYNAEIIKRISSNLQKTQKENKVLKSNIKKLEDLLREKEKQISELIIANHKLYTTLVEKTQTTENIDKNDFIGDDEDSDSELEN